jgi:hypothetical protein
MSEETLWIGGGLMRLKHDGTRYAISPKIFDRIVFENEGAHRPGGCSSCD